MAVLSALISMVSVMMTSVSFNNNNRLFMVPHLVRAQGVYKDTRIHSFHHTLISPQSRTHTHTHTHSLQIHALLVMDW